MAARLNHRVHYTIHIISEVFLLTLALSEGQYTISLGAAAGVTAVCAAFVATSVHRIARVRVHLLMLALLLDTLSLLLGVLVIGVEVAGLVYDDADASSVVWNILCFGVAASLVRIDSALHAYVQFCHEMWVWLHTRITGAGPCDDDLAEGSARPTVAGYDTVRSLSGSRHSSSSSSHSYSSRGGRRSPKSSLASFIRRSVAFTLLVVVCIIAIALWLVPDASDAYHSREEVCLVNSFNSVAKCHLKAPPPPSPSPRSSNGESASSSIAPHIGHLYRVSVNTTTLEPPQLTATLRMCLRDYPGLSVPCYVNADTRHVLAHMPRFPAGLCAGIGVLALITALSGAMTVRALVLWVGDARIFSTSAM